MKIPQAPINGTVTAATATAVTITPGVDTMDKGAVGASITTVVLNGTGFSQFRVGDNITVRVSA